MAALVATSGVTGVLLATAWGLPGYANDNFVGGVGSLAYVWSATGSGSTNAYELGYYDDYVYVSAWRVDNKFYGQPVRCVR
jgi:hypothetical protein